MSSSVAIEVLSSSTDQTISIGRKIGAHLKGGEVIELASDLGSGKTTLVKGLALGAGSKEQVSSPSFTICNEYITPKFKIYHFDFYRLNDGGIISRELAEVINDQDAVIVIEWPDVIENILPIDRLIIKIETTKDDDRQLTITSPDKLTYLVEGVK